MRKELNTFLGLTAFAAAMQGCSGAIQNKQHEANIPQNPITTPIPTDLVPSQNNVINIDGNDVPPVVTEAPIERFKAFGIDFTKPEKKITFEFDMNAIEPNKIIKTGATPIICQTPDAYKDFTPGKHTICVYQFDDSSRNDPHDFLILAHSGWVGGIDKLTMESARHLIEDVGVDYGIDKRRPVEEINSRLKSLEGSPVTVTQGDNKTELHILGALRVPNSNFGPFDKNSNLSNEDIMATLISINPEFAKFRNDGKPEIILIFCGWYNWQEGDITSKSPGYYSWSRYVIVLGK